jgi:ATP-dependent protease ClpP protease subunit
MAKEVILSGDVGLDITAQGIAEELKAARGSDVDFLLNSRGGLVFAGIEIFNLIRSYKGKTRMIITGIAASMGSYIALAADEVIAFSNTSFMVHNALALVLGNHNDMRKRADSLEGMSNILAKEYAKKTDKPLAKLKALMDEESFFFGDEILEAGFVDEIREAGEDDDTDRASALVDSRASVDACLARLRDTDAANDDFDRAVAYMDGISALMDVPKAKDKMIATIAIDVQKPAGAGKTQEDKHMTLEELLAANPTAQAEFEAAIGKARTEGETAAKDWMKALVAKVSPIITSDKYDDKVKAFGIDVITGEKTIDGFEAIVFMKDQELEAAASDAAQSETDETDETGGDGGAGGDEAAEAKAAFDEKFKNTPVGG